VSGKMRPEQKKKNGGGGLEKGHRHVQEEKRFGIMPLHYWSLSEIDRADAAVGILSREKTTQDITSEDKKMQIIQSKNKKKKITQQNRVFQSQRAEREETPNGEGKFREKKSRLSPCGRKKRESSSIKTAAP